MFMRLSDFLYIVLLGRMCLLCYCVIIGLAVHETV